MATVFIDYTQLCYTAVVRMPVPPVVRGKFVHIRNGETEYLVFSPKECTKYHAGIVERFCLDQGIEGSYDPERKLYDIFDKAWVVAGGGKFELDRARKTLRLYDDSMAYGKFDPAGLTEKLRALPEIAGYAVAVN